MNIIEKIQLEQFEKGEYTLAKDIEERLLDKDLKEVYFIAGIIKDEGYLLLDSAFETAKANGVKINFVIGIDRKTISENVLGRIKKIANTIYIHNNNNEDSFSSKLMLYVYSDSAVALIPTSNFTANAITVDHSNTTCITFDLEKDLEIYNDFMFSIKGYIYPSEEQFQLLTDKLFEKLVLERELLVSKTTDLKLPSITDYLKKSAKVKATETDKDIEEKIKKEIKSISSDFDVELDDDRQTYINDEEEIEEEIKEKPKKEVKTKKETKTKKEAKKKEKEDVNENKISNEAIDLSKLLQEDENE